MKRLPLYPKANTSAVEETAGRGLNPSCDLCPLNREGLRSPCIGADGSRYVPDAPTLLVVGDFPTYEDDGVGRIMTTSPFMRLRKDIEAQWSGSIVYDVGVRCAPGDVKVKPDFVNACRGYLAATVAEVKPARILTFGAYAGRAVLGRQIPPLSVRKGYAFTSYNAPIFMLMSPQEASWNRFKRDWLDEDLKWALDTDPKRPPWDATYGVIETREDAEQAVEKLRRSGWVTYDTEWSGLMFNGRDSYYELLDLAIVSKGNPNGWLWNREALNNPATWGPLANLLADAVVPKMGQNLKVDVMSIMARKKYRTNVKGVAGDLLLWRKGLSSDIVGSLDFAAELVGMGGHKEENTAYVKKACEQIKYARNLAEQGVQFTPGIYSNAIVAAVREPDADPEAFAYAEVPDDIRGRYCMLDTVTTDLTACLVYEEVNNDRELMSVNEHFIGPATTAFAQVEAWGMGFDREANAIATKFLWKNIDALREKIAKYGDFNPSSDDQIAKFLYQDLGIGCQKFTKNENPSVDKDALDAIKTRHPSIPLLIEHNELTTIQGTFAEGMQKHIRGDDRIHTSFRLSGTRSGRLSSANPNLQNIPSRNPDLARMIKNCFIAGPGRVLLQLDYSQLEYRVAAMLSQDPNFMQVFIDGHDCHRRTAELAAPYVYGVSIEQAEAMTDKEIKGWRSYAKCFHPDTEVLTRSGWKKIENLEDVEEVMTCEPGDDWHVSMKWDVPTDVFTAMHPSASLVHFKSEGIDIRVTPDHGMLAYTATGKPQQRVLPKDFVGKRGWVNAGTFDGGGRVIDETLLRLAVATQADGSIDGGIRFGFTKVRKIERLRGLLQVSGLRYSERSSGDVTTFRVFKADAHKVTGLLQGKSLPWSWLDLGSSSMDVVLEEAQHWDAHSREEWRMYRYTSTDQQSRDVFQAIATLRGHKTRQAGDHLSVKDTNRSRGGTLTYEEKPYDGHVACLTVPSGCVVVRDGGVPLICNQTINFGVLYGKTVRTLAKELGTTIEKAQQFYDVIMGNYAVLGNKIQEWIAYARRHGMCWTYLVTDDGIEKFRRRQLINIAGYDDYLASKAKNGSVNTPVQGTAADYMNRTVCAVVDWILGDHIPAKVINTVHDSIIIEVDERYANEVALTVKGIMERWPSAGVPIVADVELGRSWGAMKGATPTDDGWRYKVVKDNKELIAYAGNIMDVIS